MLQAKQTRTKFYNKYLYKTTLTLEGFSVARDLGQERFNRWANEPFIDARYITRTKAWHNQGNIKNFNSFLEEYDKKTYAIRVERDCVDVYTTDVDFYNSLNQKFEDIMIQRFEPDADNLEQLGSNESVILCKKLPKDRFNYRVYLLPHKLGKNKEGKIQFINFVKQMGDKVSLSDAVTTWFLTTDWNWDRRYILVDNEQTLLMLKLRNSDVVGKVYRFVIPINTA